MPPLAVHASLAGLFLVRAATAAMPEAPGLREESVTYPAGPLTLAAGLLLPSGEGPFPAAVILQGSGNSDRGNDWSRQFAEGLARRGVATLLTDKRGCGASQGDWRTADVEDLAEDALAGVAFLRSRPEVRSAQVGLVGLSQGGFVAPFAAFLDPDVSAVVSVSCTATTFAEQVRHEMRNTFRQAGLDAAGVEAGMALQSRAEDFARTGDWAPYRAALDAAVTTPLASVAAGFPQEPDSWVWGWVRRLEAFDPIRYWMAVRQPVFVALGAEDEHDNVPVAETERRLRSAFAGRRQAWEVRVFPGSGHALYEPGGSEPVVRSDVLDLAADALRGAGARPAVRPGGP